MADYDARIVDLYDGDNPDGPDHDYYRALAAERGARRILDLGCGTGILTVTFSAPGRTVVGVDPSHAMLEYARRRPGADTVRWVHGDGRSIPGSSYDLMVMTGNVAQHIPDPDWEQTLQALRQVASPGAVLSFESRNPSARAWESWVQDEPTTRETAHGTLTEWTEVDELGGGRVVLHSFNRFEATGDLVEEEVLLTFRADEVLTQQLAAAGFDVRAIWGDWQRTPFDGTQRLMVFEAQPV
ncbi:class I SAM-dependent methyltransferase [Microbacterium sp. KR10-403]|uniref:class I SAM-dependent methyltransferase n=1 Tax=Microbacterium sp. KR10-403 TaxID=3158581 RepID=UPI0032E39DEA